VPRRFEGYYTKDLEGRGELQVDDHENRETMIWSVLKEDYV